MVFQEEEYGSLSYEGKCVPGKYRLGLVSEIEMLPDGPVRTVTGEYSLLAELPESTSPEQN